MHDYFGNLVTISSHTGLRHYDQAVDAHLHAWPGVLESVDAALLETPDFALAHALRALVLASRGLGSQAKDAVARAQATAKGTQPREQRHVRIITAIIEGRVGEALQEVEAHVQRFPTDALIASTALGAYGLFAFSGRADHDAARLAFTELLAPHYPSQYPWLLAYRGWARIECGDVEAGLNMARQALTLRPSNGHNAHIVLHGLFELHQPQESLTFLNTWLPRYPTNAVMWGHLQWHGGLAEIELGRLDAAAERLRGPMTDYLPRGSPFMGLADLASLLWRLGLSGVFGLPWALAQEHAQRHFPNGANVFGELHLTMLAAASGDRTRLLAARMRLESAHARGHAGAFVAVEWVQALLALLDGDSTAAQSHFDVCLRDVVRLGGSAAQREVVEQTERALRLAVAA